MFGFQAINDFGSLTISDTYPILVFKERGQVIVENTSVVDRPAVGSAVFSQPFQQAAPPNIFIRFNSGRHNTCNIYIFINGTPGNWTGFSVRAGAIGGGTLPRHVLDYVACGLVNPSAPSGYGLVVYDAAGNPTYRSDERAVKYTKFTKSWVRNDDGGITLKMYPAGVTIDIDDFIEVSSFNRGNAHSPLIPYYMYSGISILSGGVRELSLHVQNSSALGSGGPMELATTFFCMPICKFPDSIYFN